MNPILKLEKSLSKDMNQKEAFLYFDALEPVELSMMQGLWKGRELRIGHPMEGLLAATKWFGKKFDNVENAYPLVFETCKHKLYYGNPGLLPINIYEKIPVNIISIFFPIIGPFVSTRKSKARLRLIKYRGKVSASMVYDQVAIIDIFRKIDDNTVMGVMDYKEDRSGKSFFFILERVK